MIIDHEKNPVAIVTPLPSVGGMLHITWTYNMPESGQIAGFFVIYDCAGQNRTVCLEKLRQLHDEDVTRLLHRGGWVGNAPTGNDASLIWAIPAGTADFKVQEETFRAPCKIEVWTIIRDNEVMRLLCEGGPSYHCPLKLQYSIKTKDFVPAQYGAFHRLKAPAVTGVELVLHTDGAKSVYESGAVCYRLKSDPERTMYPIAKEAINRPLQFCSTSRFQYRANDFELVVDPHFQDMYQL